MKSLLFVAFALVCSGLHVPVMLHGAPLSSSNETCAEYCGSNNACSSGSRNTDCPRCDLLSGQCTQGWGCGCLCEVDSDCDQSSTSEYKFCNRASDELIGRCGFKIVPPPVFCGAFCSGDDDCDTPKVEPLYSCSKCDKVSSQCRAPRIPSPCLLTNFTKEAGVQLNGDYHVYDGIQLDECLGHCCEDDNCVATTFVNASWGTQCYMHNHTTIKNPNNETAIYTRVFRPLPPPPPPPPSPPPCPPSPPDECIAPYPGEPHKNCSSMLDLIFILDGSGSISSPDWRLIKHFTLQIGLNFSSAPALMSYGIVQFASDAAVYMHMTPSNSTFQGVMATMKQMQSSTNTFSGLKAAATEQDTNGRVGAYKVVVMMTDGEWNSGGDPTQFAAEMKANGTHLYCIAIGQGATDKVKALASDPKEAYYFDVESEDALPVVLHDIINNMCAQSADEEDARDARVTLKYEPRPPHPKM